MLLNNISDAVFSTNKNFVVTTWNKAATEMYGYTSEEAVGKTVHELIEPNITPTQISQDLDSLHLNDFHRDEYQCKTKSGQVLDVMASINVIRNAVGDLVGYVAVHRNISDRKKTEERIRYLASLIDQASDAIFSLDAERKIRSWNKGAEEMYGYKRDEVIGKIGMDVTKASYTREEFNKLPNRLIPRADGMGTLFIAIVREENLCLHRDNSFTKCAKRVNRLCSGCEKYYRKKIAGGAASSF